LSEEIDESTRPASVVEENDNDWTLNSMLQAALYTFSNIFLSEIRNTRNYW
jgi:hypothetical protein